MGAVEVLLIYHGRWEPAAGEAEVMNMHGVPTVCLRPSSLSSQGDSASDHHCHPKFQIRKPRPREVNLRAA